MPDILILVLALIALAISITGIVKCSPVIAACGQILGVVSLFIILSKMI